MVKVSLGKSKTFYVCEQCGFKYRDRETAKKCEDWCRDHKSCNLEIIKSAIQENGN